MTTQEAISLAAERQENLKYRKKIQRIKNTILGAIGGGFAGFLAGGMATDKPSPLDIMLNKPMPKGKILGGAALGATLGGLTGYGATRLKENYDESAGLDPTLKNFVVNYNNKQASSSLEKKAIAASIGRLIGKGSSGLGRLLGNLATNSGRMAAKAGRFSKKKLERFFELLGGGNENVLKDYNKLKRIASEDLEFAKTIGRDVEGKQKALDTLKDAFLNGELPAGKTSFDIPLPGGGVKSIVPTKEISDELGKIIAARTLAVGGLAGGGYYAAKKYNEYKNRPWYLR